MTEITVKIVDVTLTKEEMVKFTGLMTELSKIAPTELFVGEEGPFYKPSQKEGD